MPHPRPNRPTSPPAPRERFVSRSHWTLGLALLLALHAVGPEIVRADPAHQYTLQARLDPALHSVEGSGTIVWTNESRVPQNEIWLHLYLNAFAHPRTVFMRESGGQLRGVRFDGSGGIRVRTLRWGGHDLLPGAGSPAEPSDGSTVHDDDAEDAADNDTDTTAATDTDTDQRDETEWRVPLPRAVAPGESISLEVEWTSRLPPVFARSGYHGDFHVVAQWFPKLARLEPDGTWASFPYHGNGEFYADYARYDLTVETPPGWQVGATGENVLDEVTGGWARRRFVADNVLDTVFVTAPWLRTLESEVQRADGSAIAITVLFPPGYESAAERHLEVTRRGLAHYGRILFEYPYDQLTVVVPPRGADGAAGMEYPQLFITAGPWFQMNAQPMGAHDEVTAHELGHQWFQGMVGTHEVRWPMLDEGLTEWITGDCLREIHGPSRSGASWPFPLDGFEIRRAVALSGDAVPPPATAAYGFPDGGYGKTIYFRTASVLETVARTWGRARIWRALGRYANDQKFKHPVPDDLFRAFDAEYGSWMSRRILRPALFENATAEHALDAPVLGAGRTRVTGTRTGGLRLPTRVRLRGSSGEHEVRWDGHQDALIVDVEGTYEIAEADPYRRNMLDPDRRNDAVALPGARDDVGVGPFVAWFQTLIAWLGP